MSGKAVVAFLMMGCLASAAWALEPAEIREKVEDMLAERHPDDQPSRWTSLGASAPGVIIRIAEETPRAAHRLRLVGALRFFPDSPEALEYLKKIAETSPLPVLKRSAVRSVGLSQGAREAEFVAGFLSSDDPSLRAAAAETLQAMRDPRAEARLRKHLETEKTPWIVAKLKDAKAPGSSGRPVPAPSPAHSAGPIDPLWLGSWKGVALKPDATPGSLRSEEARFIFDPGGRRLEVVMGKTSRVLEEVRFEGKRFMAKARLGTGSSSPLEPVEGECFERGGALMAQIQAPRSGTFLILRKSP